MARTAEYPLPEFEAYLTRIGSTYAVLAAIRRLWSVHHTDLLSTEQLQAYELSLPLSSRGAFRTAWRYYREHVLMLQNRSLSNLVAKPRGRTARPEKGKDAPTTYAQLFPELVEHLPPLMAATGLTPVELEWLRVGHCKVVPDGIELKCNPPTMPQSKWITRLVPAQLVRTHLHPVMRWGYPGAASNDPEAPLLPSRPGGDMSMEAEKIKSILKAAADAEKRRGTLKVVTVAALPTDGEDEEKGCAVPGCFCTDLVGASGKCSRHGPGGVFADEQSVQP